MLVTDFWKVLELRAHLPVAGQDLYAYCSLRTLCHLLHSSPVRIEVGAKIVLILVKY